MFQVVFFLEMKSLKRSYVVSLMIFPHVHIMKILISKISKVVVSVDLSKTSSYQT
jgi:hypothetical protein